MWTTWTPSNTFKHGNVRIPYNMCNTNMTWMNPSNMDTGHNKIMRITSNWTFMNTVTWSTDNSHLGRLSLLKFVFFRFHLFLLLTEELLYHVILQVDWIFHPQYFLPHGFIICEIENKHNNRQNWHDLFQYDILYTIRYCNFLLRQNPQDYEISGLK